MRRTGPTNIVVRKLITQLRKASKANDAPIWGYVADLLGRPSRKRVVVNISRINRYAEDGDVIVVPGKVLGAGLLNKKVTVAALSFSETALLKIKSAGGKVLTIEDLIRENPRGSGVRVLG
ncbi:MAG: 50S ribosomal protein L18e [Desulfurococcales archaeon]|nr:50S ribosomal protein L18e [Desulfurococcales archaeon]